MKKLRMLLVLMLVLIMSALISGCSKYIAVKKDAVQNTEIKTTEGETEISKIKEEQELESKYNIIVNEEDVAFTDGRGEQVTIKKNPQKVVCLYNSYLDIWDNCGGTVIGRVEESEEKPVENAKSAEEVGTAGAPSLEKIIALQPDLVIMTTAYAEQREMISTLEKSNIQVLALDNDYIDDYLGTVKLFTALTGREDLYEKQALEVKKNVEEIIKKAPEDKNYKVLLLFATAKSLSVRDSNSMVGEMLEDLNTVNISDSEVETADTKTFSMEKILQEDPDFIFVLTMGNDMEKIQERLKSDAEDNPAWASLTAVKEDRYIVLPKDIYMYKPNNRYPEAYEGLAEILYPEVFK
ncbi:MAG: ABC transporter substrate-binding protein [Sedimentibacter sp.]